MEGGPTMPADFTTAFTWVWDNLTAVLTFITGSALLLLPFAFKMSRKAISAVKSLMGTGGGRGYGK